MKKKIIETVLNLVLSFSLVTINVSAVTNDLSKKEFLGNDLFSENCQDDETTEILYSSVNEYEALKLKQENLKKDIANGKTINLPQEEVEYLIKLQENFTNHLNDLRKENENTLVNWGYDDNQIKVIKSMDRSESALIIASATCDVTLGFNLYQMSNSSGAARLICDFHINGRLAGYGEDIFAVIWSDTWYSEVNDTSSNLCAKGYLSYSSTNYSNWGDINTLSTKVYANGLNSNKIVCPKFRSTNGVPNTHFIRGGSMVIPLITSGYNPSLIGFASYATRTSNLSSSISVGLPKCVGMSFSWQTGFTELDNARNQAN